MLHEFGHALGLIHEHQSPFPGGFEWNREAVSEDTSLLAQRLVHVLMRDAEGRKKEARKVKLRHIKIRHTVHVCHDTLLQVI